jgi:hypothetical protein
VITCLTYGIETFVHIVANLSLRACASEPGGRQMGAFTPSNAIHNIMSWICENELEDWTDIVIHSEWLP